MIMCCNALMAVGYAFTIYAELWAVFVGRITLGLGVGSYCVYCIKFVSELAPIEYRGPIGAVAEFSIATGRFFPAIGGLFIDQNDPLKACPGGPGLDHGGAGEYMGCKLFIPRIIWAIPTIMLVL